MPPVYRVGKPLIDSAGVTNTALLRIAKGWRKSQAAASLN